MKRKILIVDSELSIRMMLENFLSDDYDVTTVENGFEAISWLQHGNRADLLLVDTDMSMINGYEFKQSIKKQKGMASVPVIMFSAENKNRMNTTPAQQPINQEEIMTKINSAFRKATA